MSPINDIASKKGLMTTEDFFEALQQQFIRKMPFVAYRKPKDISVKALFQHEDTIHYSSDLYSLLLTTENRRYLCLYTLRKL